MEPVPSHKQINNPTTRKTQNPSCTFCFVLTTWVTRSSKSLNCLSESSVSQYKSETSYIRELKSVGSFVKTRDDPHDQPEESGKGARSWNEGKDLKNVAEYVDETSQKYKKMVEWIANDLEATTLKYQSVDDMVKAIGLPREKLCVYCWTGEYPKP